MHTRSTFRLGPLLAVTGVGLLIVGTALHPMQADPAVTEAAFTEYAADRHSDARVRDRAGRALGRPRQGLWDCRHRRGSGAASRRWRCPENDGRPLGCDF